MGSRLECFIQLLTAVHRNTAVRAHRETSDGILPGFTASVMDDVFFSSLEDGWFGFSRTAFSFSAMACAAALVLFIISGTMSHGTYVDRMFNGLMNDPAGLLALYYMEF